MYVYARNDNLISNHQPTCLRFPFALLSPQPARCLYRGYNVLSVYASLSLRLTWSTSVYASDDDTTCMLQLLETRTWLVGDGRQLMRYQRLTDRREPDIVTAACLLFTAVLWLHAVSLRELTSWGTHCCKHSAVFIRWGTASMGITINSTAYTLFNRVIASLLTVV